MSAGRENVLRVSIEMAAFSIENSTKNAAVLNDKLAAPVEVQVLPRRAVEHHTL